MPAALRLQEIRRTGAVGAEMKIKTDRGPADGEAVDKNARDEILSGEFGKLGVKVQHDRTVEAGSGEQAQFGGFGREPEQRFVGMKESARMRFEGERGRGLAEPTRPRQRGSDHCLVAAMHAVEIADGDG